MKKRRELDALVSGVKGQKNGRHELLRNESESSEEVEEFAMPQKTVVRKRVRSQCCSTFATMCWVFLLAICLVSIGGLIWMVIQLKNDVSELQNSLAKAERAQTHIQELSDSQMEMKEKLDQLTSAEIGFPKLHANFSDWSKKLMALNSTVNQLVSQASSKPPAADTTTELKDLQDNMKKLFKTVADIGSSQEETKQEQSSLVQQLTDVRSDIAALQLTSISKSTLTTKPAVVQNEILLQHFQQELRQLTSEMTAVNETLCGKIQQLSDLIHVHNISITAINNTSGLISQRVSALERRPSSNQLEDKAIANLVRMEVEKYENRSSEKHIDLEALNIFQAKFDALQSSEANRTAIIASLASNFSSTSKRLNLLSAIVADNAKLLNETKSQFAVRLQQVEADVYNMKTTTKQYFLSQQSSTTTKRFSQQSSTLADVETVEQTVPNNRDDVTDFPDSGSAKTATRERS